MEPLLLLLVLAAVILLYLYATRHFDFWRSHGIPFEKPVPFVGNIPLMLFRKCIGVYLKELYEKSTGPLYGFFLFDKPHLVLRDREIIKQILIKDFQNFYNRTLTMNMKDDPIGSQMLFLIHNPDWRRVRQKVTRAFTTGKLKMMFPLMVEASSDYVKYVEKLNGACVETKNLALRFSTDVIASCAFGVKGFSFVKKNSEFFAEATKIFGFTWRRGVQMTFYFISPFMVNFFKMKFLHPESGEFMKNIFWNVVNLRKKTMVKRNDLIDSLLEIKEADKDVSLVIDGDLALAQAVQFIVAGYETSGSTACFTMYELARHPDVQNRLRAEILEVRQRHKGLTYEAVQDMKYLEMVTSGANGNHKKDGRREKPSITDEMASSLYSETTFAEVLRRYPVLPFLDRRAQNDYKIPNTNLTIPKGMGVFVPTLGLHFDPEYFPDPYKFDPERFTPEKKANLPPCTYMPFGEGPRNCIGKRFGSLSSKLSVISMVSNFEILTTDDTPPSIDFDARGFLLAPVQPVMLRFKKIEA